MFTNFIFETNLVIVFIVLIVAQFTGTIFGAKLATQKNQPATPFDTLPSILFGLLD